MAKVYQGFDPMDPEYLMAVVVMNARRDYLNSSVAILISRLLDIGNTELVSDFIQLAGTGVVLRSRMDPESQEEEITEEEIESFQEWLDRMPEVGDEDE